MSKKLITITKGASAKDVSDAIGKFLDEEEIIKRPVLINGTDERLSEINDENVLAISVAEGGAMGCPGQIVIAEGMGDHVDFIEFFDAGKLQEIFPWFAEVRNWIFGQLENIDSGWHYIDMGAGNNLFIENKAYDRIGIDFENRYCLDIYRYWKAIVSKYYRR